jgi:ABC-type transporter MlaC component
VGTLRDFFAILAGTTFLLATAISCPASPAGAQEIPLDVVRDSNQAVLEIYAGREKIDQAAEEEIFRIIDGVTNFEAMADAVADRFCPKLTGEQCREFKDVFIELLRTSSVKKLGRYRAESFDYVPTTKMSSSASSTTWPSMKGSGESSTTSSTTWTPSATTANSSRGSLRRKATTRSFSA